MAQGVRQIGLLDTLVKSATLHFYEILNGVDRIERICGSYWVKE